MKLNPLTLLVTVLLAVDDGRSVAAATRLSDYIRPMVGTKGAEGTTYPGPSAPFGMIQLSPDTDTTNWDTDAGYAYADPTIQGFSLTHLTGTGCPDLGDFLFQPQVGTPELMAGPKDHPEQGYQSAYAHADETAAAGYYRVTLQKPGVVAELTAGERAGILRFTFPASDQASILTDLSHVINGGRWRVAESRVRVEDNATITGFHLVNGWAKERYLYFAARYSRPFDRAVIYSAGKPVIYNTYRFRSHKEAAGTNLQFLAQYKTHAQEAIEVKVAISAVSTADALQNLDTEIPGWDFNLVREATSTRWPGTRADHHGRQPATKGNVLHLAVPRLAGSQSVSGCEWRLPGLRPKYSPGQRLHRIRRVFLVGHLSRRTSLAGLDSGAAGCGHD